MDLPRSCFPYAVLAALMLSAPLGGGCAAPRQEKRGEPQAGVAAPKLAPHKAAAAALMPAPAAEPVDDDAEPQRESQANVVGILSRAYQLHGRGDYAGSIALFRLALETQELNSGGRALAYWHVWLGEKDLVHAERADDALASFITSAEEVLATAASGGAEEEDFAARFAISRKLARARAEQSSAWTAHHQELGRTRARPIVVYSQAEMSDYLALMPPCAKDIAWQVEEQDVALGAPKNGLLWVRLSCQGKEHRDLFFEHHTAHAALPSFQ